MVEPTSLRRGEGLEAGSLRVFGAKCGGEARWWWRGTRESEPTGDRDLVDGGLKLRSPSQIAFDIDTLTSDNKIPFLIIL